MDEFALPGVSQRSGFGRKVLRGVTIMLVEDSRSASTAAELLAIALGARLRRASSIETALRHLSGYRPNIVAVDLGLPDGNGLSLLESLASGPPPHPGLVAMSGNAPEDWVLKARAVGAGAVLEKPIGGIDAFAKAMLAVLPDAELRRAGSLPDQPGTVEEPEAVEEDLRQLREQLSQAIAAGDDALLDYCAQFLFSLAKQTGDKDLQNAAGSWPGADGADRQDVAAGLLETVQRKVAGQAA